MAFELKDSAVGRLGLPYAVREDLLAAGSVLLTRKRLRSAGVACRMVRDGVEIVHD